MSELSAERPDPKTQTTIDGLAPYARALLDYLEGRLDGVLLLENLDREPEVDPAAETRALPVAVFFRAADQLLPFEVRALDACRGVVADLGAGAGPHSLALQGRGLEVVAVEVSSAVCEVLRRRGVERVVEADAVEDDLAAALGGRVDTLLLMMNGFGMLGDLETLRRWLRRAHAWLRPGGQILADGIDLEANRPEWVAERRRRCPERYPGETRVRMRYDDLSAESRWLGVDPRTLWRIADDVGWRTELLEQRDDGVYLARLSVAQAGISKPVRGV